MWPGKILGRWMDAKEIGWMSANVKLVTKREGTEKHRLYHCPEWYEVRREIPEAFIQKVGAKGENVEERMEVAKRYSRAPTQ